MIASGVLTADEHVELLDGLIVSEFPPRPAQASCAQWLSRRLCGSLDGSYAVRPRIPLVFGEWNQPEPDLAVVRAPAEDRRLEAALLVVEVAGDSLRKDRKVKAAVYARAGVPEYWIVNVEGKAVEVFTDPAAGGYRRAREIARPAVLAAESLPVSFSLAELFP